MSLFTRIRSAASKLAHGWGEKAIESAFELPPSRLPLLGFAKDTVDKWQLQTDSPIGGFSECSLTPFHAGIHVDDAPRLLRPSAMWAGHTSPTPPAPSTVLYLAHASRRRLCCMQQFARVREPCDAVCVML